MSFLYTPNKCWFYWAVLLLGGGSAICIRNREHWKSVKKQNSPSEEKPVPPPPDPEEVYKDLAKKKWLRSYQGVTTLSYNKNVDALFYDRKAYEIQMLAANDLETVWRRRVLMESTPRGLVIMYFNAYKRGFTYFADQSIPYALINAVAMKYVVLYFCRDFFIDEMETMDLILSPLIDLYEKDAFQKKPVGDKKGEKAIDIKSGPFLKSKHFVQKSQLQASSGGSNMYTNVASTGSASKSEPMKEYVKNRFVYEGKICNYSLLQKYDIVKAAKPSKKVSPIKYSDFKNWHHPQTPQTPVGGGGGGGGGGGDSLVPSMFCQPL